ncbi:MAG: hypothetical protein WEB50_11745 [Vicinamibacterales bacterium]
MTSSPGSPMSLQKELETFKKRLPEWPEHEGKFVLIHGEDVIDFYTSYEDALKVGYEKFKLEPFLVKQVHALERIQFVSRFVDPCLRHAV